MTRRMKSRVRVVHDGGMRSERGNSVHGWRVLIDGREVGLISREYRKGGQEHYRALTGCNVAHARSKAQALSLVLAPFEVIGAELGR